MTVRDALAALREGRPVLVLDDASRENEGDVVLAGQTLTQEWMAWTIRHTSGYVCAPMEAERADRLALPPMHRDNADPLRTAYTITCDAALGVTTGISAADRAHTVSVLADEDTTATDLVRPGHVIPLRARPGGVLERRGHTEACVDLCRLAGLTPVGAIAELVHDDGTMMRAPAVRELAHTHGLVVIDIADLVDHRQRFDRVRRVTTTTLPTRHGTFTVHGYQDLLTGAEHICLQRSAGTGTPLVRLHSECLTGDAFGSTRCDCGPQLDEGLRRVAAEGGAVVLLRGHEGRGTGLLAKLRAYTEQDAGADTVEAQERLGLPVDAREYGAGAAILHDLGLTEVRLLTNNPVKQQALRDAGITLHREPTTVALDEHNLRYLRTKQLRMHHQFDTHALEQQDPAHPHPHPTLPREV